MKILALLCLLPFVYSAQLAGGWHHGHVNHEITALAKRALSHYNTQLGADGETKTFSKVVSVQTQVVSGINYKFTMEVVDDKTNKVETCSFTVWYQSWTDLFQVTHSECPVQSRRGLPGGVEPASTSDADVVKALSFAMDNLNSRSNSMFRLGVSKVVKVEKQVVAGMKYNFEVEIGMTGCRNSQENQNKLLDACPVSSNDVMQTCEFQILWQAWMPNPYSMLHSSCH